MLYRIIQSKFDCRIDEFFPRIVPLEQSFAFFLFVDATKALFVRVFHFILRLATDTLYSPKISINLGCLAFQLFEKEPSSVDVSFALVIVFKKFVLVLRWDRSGHLVVCLVEAFQVTVLGIDMIEARCEKGIHLVGHWDHIRLSWVKHV